MSQYADLVVNTGTRVTDRLYTYEIPEELRDQIKKGSTVLVPFGRGSQTREGLVLKFRETCSFKTKPILSIVNSQPPLSEEAIFLASWMIEENLSDFNSAFQTVLPPGSSSRVKPKIKGYYQLTKEGEKASPRENAIKQKNVLALLAKEGALEQSRLFKETGASSETLKSLIQKGWIEKSQRRVYRRVSEDKTPDQKKELTFFQREAYEKILAKKGTYLLCGVTGSGKTEIYLQLVEHALGEGKEAIILVPEISLTPQTIHRFESRFGKKVAILHSRLSLGERYDEWEKIARGEVSIAIGARSAIFAPFHQLGIIVIDEEHESSYISEKNPKYHTDEIARLRANYHHCSLVLGSATPSFESLYRVEKGEMVRINLPERTGGRPLPHIEIVDMREELKRNNRSMFSVPLKTAMDQALEEGQQVILFLNRRGHTSFVFCRSCGYVYRCDACDVAMTYHKGRERLVCHYCGREKRMENRCPQCGSQAIKEFGAGTEQLEEEAKKLFPQARIKRADADTMRVKGAYSRVYHDMLEKKIDILIGTQMIAKGFDFPAVTVVGIMAADISLNLPDFRAAERTFQLITQVAGRSGRGEVPGRVFIQTYKADHPAIVYASRQEIDPFYRWERQNRYANAYPPFSRELFIRISGYDRNQALKRGWQIQRFLDEQRETAQGKIKNFADHLSDREKINKISMRIDGPVPCVIERIDRRYRFFVMVRSNDGEALKVLGREIIQRFPSSRELLMNVSLDPLSEM